MGLPGGKMIPLYGVPTAPTFGQSYATGKGKGAGSFPPYPGNDPFWRTSPAAQRG